MGPGFAGPTRGGDMKGVTSRLVSLALAGVMLIGLLAGCGQTKKPAATSVPPTPRPTDLILPPTASSVPGESGTGEADEQQADLDRKIEEYTQAIALDPQDADAYYNRGNAYAQRGDLDLAIADLDQAIALDPQDAEAYFSRALAYAQAGQFDQALLDLNKGIDINPRDATAHYLRGAVYAQLGEREEAISDLERALDLGLDPDLKTEAEALLDELGH